MTHFRVWLNFNCVVWSLSCSAQGAARSEQIFTDKPSAGRMHFWHVKKCMSAILRPSGSSTVTSRFHKLGAYLFHCTCAWLFLKRGGYTGQAGQHTCVFDLSSYSYHGPTWQRYIFPVWPPPRRLMFSSISSCLLVCWCARKIKQEQLNGLAINLMDGLIWVREEPHFTFLNITQ